MKKKLLLLGICSLGFFSSCESFLEEKPYDFLTASNFYQNEGDAIAGLNGVFSLMQAQTYYGRTVWLVTELPGDYMAVVGATTGDRAELSRFTYTANNGEIGNWWVNNYRLIGRANDLIDKVPAVSMNEASKNNILGNARFLRALAYFELVRSYGDVPLITSPIKGPNDDLRPARTPKAAVYEQIIEDLQFAEANCLKENQIPAGNKGRVSSGAAASLLAKVYLTRASSSDAKGTDNQDALAACNRVINSGLYSLMPTYGDVFLPDRENNAEHIFSVQFDLPPNVGNIIVRQNLPAALGGFASFTAEDWFVKSYAATDVRKDWNLSNKANTTTLPQYYFNKFRDDKRIGNDSRVNWLVTRYADVLLMQSEALNNLNAADVTKYQGINRVRQRAGLAALPTTATTKDAFVDLLVLERAWELCDEGHRRYDLIRLNRLKQVEKTIFNRDISDNYLLFPIPQTEIALNPNLTQNPGF
ncbi:RagB/SusD family nutrient uptake outer membrane protein [Hymenobacter taeanensis]|uniref:RagB/SusD family nutrient uptake outer membrane protein n=1 Tax=Hymenobacter taeanensis TaxID=2735321 RepID=A0A6M6BIT9_9BACT|nr:MULTISPECIES: RagB/SusD family nutrient uptake outer membrane protein [Hymenobacter]QJX47922.1 RagB/SusD family nutrient uptake outer membrane protein [Hymenobacter taeanensis]UOQ82628.1 RagB/SusD family nutrient uptake outer membrane protein [Hymenobacter sp. 5414T-23]